ncbi:MAG: hypothetical protein ACTSQJ_16210 [Promethearchaeota archaeon]
MGLKHKIVERIMPKEFHVLTGLFHICIFTLQSNIIKTLGEIGFKDYVFPRITKKIKNLERVGLNIIESESLEEFVQRFIRLLKKSFLVENAIFERKSEDKFIFSLERCFMAKTAHKIAGFKGLCPMAMIMASMIEKYLGKNVSVGYSELTDHGSNTLIKFL